MTFRRPRSSRRRNPSWVLGRRCPQGRLLRQRSLMKGRRTTVPPARPSGVGNRARAAGSPGPAAMEDEGVGEGQDGEGAAASGAGGLPQHADLWACEQGGVQRVFVDHPLFASTGGFGW